MHLAEFRERYTDPEVQMTASGQEHTIVACARSVAVSEKTREAAGSELASAVWRFRSARHRCRFFSRWPPRPSDRRRARFSRAARPRVSVGSRKHGGRAKDTPPSSVFARGCTLCVDALSEDTEERVARTRRDEWTVYPVSGAPDDEQIQDALHNDIKFDTTSSSLQYDSELTPSRLALHTHPAPRSSRIQP